jgi:hypothetical protein
MATIPPFFQQFFPQGMGAAPVNPFQFPGLTGQASAPGIQQLLSQLAPPLAGTQMAAPAGFAGTAAPAVATAGQAGGAQAGLMSRGGSVLSRAAIPLGIFSGGQLLSNAVDPEKGTTQRAIADAATGAAIGSVGGPITAAIGGALGLGWGLFGPEGGGGSGDQTKQLEELVAQLGLNPSTYTAQLDIQKELLGDDKAATQAVLQQALADYQTNQQATAAESQFQRQESFNRGQDQSFLLAMQAQTAKFFQPFTDNILTSGIQQAQTLSQLAPSLPEPYRSVMLAQSASQLGNAQRLASAYSAQAMLLPSQYMMSQDLERQSQLANDQWKMMVLQQQSAGQQAGSQDIATLVEQLTGGG